MEPHRGTLILIFGIIGLTVCQPFGIAAWLMGNADLKKMAAGQMDPEGEDLTKAGKICGIIGTILMILITILLIVYLIFVFLIIGAAATGAAGDGLQLQ